MKKLGVLLAALGVAAIPSAAAASGPQLVDHGQVAFSRAIDQYTAHYYIHEDGTTDVTLDFLFNFNDEPGHGPYLTYPIRVPYDDKNDRFYPISHITASSPSGAPAKVYTDTSKYWLEIRIGDENQGNISGVQEYQVSYTVDGLLNETSAADLDANVAPADDIPLWDEFYVNVLGDQWTIPLDRITIVVEGDAPAEEAVCYAGAYGSTDSCTGHGVSDGVATFAQSHLDAYSPMSVAVKFPLGSFDTDPILRTKNDLAYALSVTPFTATGALILLAGGVIGLVAALRGKATDEQYAGLTPGLAPVGTDAARIVKRDYSAPVAVQFQPPPGLRPGQLGTLIDEKADTRDVTATIVDLAVRGYLRIDPVGEEKKRKKRDYSFVKLRDADGAMVGYESMLFEGIFTGRDEVKLSDLKTTFASTLAKVQAQMYKNVTALGWFRGNPSTARTMWGAAGIGLLVVGGGLMWVAGSAGPFALIFAPLPIIGLMVLFTIKNAPARKAEGTRVLAQARGFETFLSTADGNKLRFEEGRDIFSLYLPFAIAFGVADKWSAVFERLAAQGHQLAEPTWYGGYYGAFWATQHDFGRTMNEFVSLADAAISAPAPGSSGGSGFGGGGGFSGGGGFGGGGGGW